MAKRKGPVATTPADEPVLAAGQDASPRDDRWVRIATLDDRIQARALCELLERAGIPCATPGAEHRGLLGFIGAYIQIPVQVPAAHRAEAKRLYDAFVLPGIDSRVPSAHDDTDDADDDEPSGPPRLKRIAAYVSCSGIGLGHLYARETYSALVIFLSQIASVIFLCGGGTASIAVGAVFVALYDLVGSMWAVDRFNRGEPRSEVASVLVTVVAVAVLHLLAVPATTLLETYAPPHRGAPAVPAPQPF
jgi:hypothetical protein